jgi:endoglucanase
MNWKLFILSLFLIYCSESVSSEKGKDTGVKDVDPFEQNILLQHSINLGNALEAPSPGEWGVVLEESYFKLIKEAGFTAVRIPCRWSAHTNSSAPFKIQSDFMNLVKWALNQAQKNDLAAVINIHHFNELFSNPDQEKDRFLSIWEQLAGELKDYPTSVFFEVLNEPHDKLTAELWNVYLQEAVNVIRSIDSTHTLIIGTAEWGGVAAMQKLKLPENEDNLIFTFHYYNPFQFTHQGAEWMDGSDEWLGTQWLQSPTEVNAIRSEFEAVKVWAKQHNVPVFLGEFGAYNKADMDSRARWTNFVAREAEKNNFSWAYWEFIAGFGVYDGEQNSWREPLLNALIP